MRTSRIRSFLGLAALTTLTLLAGASQADNRGFQPDDGFRHAGHGFHGHPGPAPYRPAAFSPPQWGAPSVDARQAWQIDRIHDGLREGDLTRHEAKYLLRDQRRIEKVERRYLADGHLSRNEWLDLDRRLDEAARDIRAERQDFDRQGHGMPEHRGRR